MVTLATLVLTIGASAHSASLTGEQPHVGTGILLAQEVAAPPPAPGVAPAPRTLQELHAERDRLEATRPSIGGPIAMLAVGAGLCLVGLGVGLGGLELLLAYFFTSGATFYGSTLTTAFIVAGFVLVGIALVAIGVGIPLAVIGGVRLKKSLNERTAIGAEMNVIDDQIKALEDNAPPPAPLPTSVEREQGPLPLALVSTF